MTLNAIRPKVPHICWTTVRKSQISHRFALRSLVFHIIYIFGFHRVQWWIWKFSKNIVKTWKLKNPQRSFVGTFDKIIQEKFDKYRLQFVKEVAFLGKAFYFRKKISSAPNDLKMTLNSTRPNVPYVCWTTNQESQISPRFALRSLVSR